MHYTCKSCVHIDFLGGYYCLLGYDDDRVNGVITDPNKHVCIAFSQRIGGDFVPWEMRNLK